MTKVVVALDREAAADVLALVTSFDRTYTHPFTLSCGKGTDVLREVLTREECAAGDERYSAFAETVQ